MGDRYDAAVEYLTAHPEEIAGCWLEAGRVLIPPEQRHPASCLFDLVADKVFGVFNPPCGCLTLIRANPKYSQAFVDNRPDYALTAEISADERIPKDQNAITVSDLPVFAEWQRKLAIRFGRYDNAETH